MIEIHGLDITLGSFRLKEVDLSVESGCYGVVLGPTGAGKTVLLECIAGLHTPRRGRIVLDGVDVTGTPPEARGVAYVPQDYCLFPHLTVASNIAFGLRLRRWGRRAIAERVDQLADTLKIDELLDRRPATLSGGEQQRVALARALAVEPRVLLLDEPLAAVDERTRERLSGELKAVQRRFSTTIIHVCHNFEEALALADDITVFAAGEVRQAGRPEEIFQRPASEFVARFLGCGNLIRGEVIEDGGRTEFRAGGFAVLLTEVRPGPALLVIRPEEVQIGAADALRWAGQVTSLVRGQRFYRLGLEAAGTSWEAICSPALARELSLGEGAPVSIDIPPERCHLLPDKPADREGTARPGAKARAGIAPDG